MKKCPKCGAKTKIIYVPPDFYTPDGRVVKCTKCKWNDYL